ncbi:MAG: HDIG domain-containing protein [Thermodesulfovibrionales bacterium]|nr:HDIG domain-containing protein [Thermodesulfovibrionales bacterium]
MNIADILLRHYGPGSAGHEAAEAFMRHSELVASRAEEIALGLALGYEAVAFVREGAMLHDIGIYLTDAPKLGCTGGEPYIRHGVLGREILESHGLMRHALVCETHVGAGLTAEEIRASGLPLPERDMLPGSIEEKIICVADKFYRKSGANGHLELTVEEARMGIARYGEGPATRFDAWLDELGITG